MNHLKSFLILLALLSHNTAGLITEEKANFVHDYMTYKNARTISCITCSKKDSLYLTKYLMSAGSYWMVSPDPDESPTKLVPQIMKRDYRRFGVFVDFDCAVARNYLAENSDRKLMNATFYWLIWSKEKYGSEIENLNLHMDTEMTWAYSDESLNQTVLYDLYKITYDWPINATLAGHWTSDEGFVWNLTQYKYARRQDMRGARLRTGIVVNNIPIENLQDELLKPENKIRDAMATYNNKIFLMMMDFYNFTRELIITHQFGLVVDDGNYEGMVKLIHEREVDISISVMLFNVPRMDFIDYCSVQTWKFRMCALFRHPPITGAYSVLLKPFEPSLWAGCGLMWFIMMVALRFISFFENQYHVEDNEDVPEEEAWTWSDTLVIIMGAVSQQGSTMDSKWVTGRIVFLNTHILALMMNVYYSAFVVSSLLSAPTQSIHNTRDLIDSSLEFGAEDINYNRPYFEMNTDPLIHELFMKKMSPPHKGYFSRELGLHKVETERFAFHIEPINIYHIIEKTFPEEAKCDLTEILVFPIEPCYPIIPKSSPFKEIFTYSYRRAVEAGLVDYMNQNWRPVKPPCTSKTEYRRVGIDTILFGIWLLGAGLVLAIFFFILELIVKSRLCLRKKRDFPTSLQRNVSALPWIEDAKPRVVTSSLPLEGTLLYRKNITADKAK